MLIDTHTHVGLIYDHYEPLTPRAMLDWMDAHDVEKVVLLPLESPEGSSFYLTTWDILKVSHEHPDRFIPFCVVDPRMYVSRGRDSFRNIIGHYVHIGAKGFGEVIPGLAIDHPLQQETFAVCDDMKLAIVLHMDNRCCFDTPDLKGLETVVRNFPNATFIGHGPGFWAPISADVTQEEMGDYPKRPVVPGGRVDALMTQYPNLWADLSAGSGSNALMRDWEYGQAFLERHRKKLLFGTDYLHPAQNIPHFEMFASAAISNEARRAIGSENAIRLLNL